MERNLPPTAVPSLLEWYGRRKRDLPWRKNRTPYTVLVSEFMLQQTRVEAVKERYLAFLDRFPTAESLASASEDEVLKAWEGLGYYTRARNLHAAAKKIAEDGFPQTFAGVRALPGVGDYTAGAIASTALGLPEPAVDGNVLRILSRLCADPSCTDLPQTKRAYAGLLRDVYPKETADFCEALMELGAIVCLPNGSPLCGECPWKDICRAHLCGQEDAFPVRKEKRERKIVPLTVYVLRFGGRYALRKRGKGLLSGLWEFPSFEKETSDFGTVREEKRAKHVFTHVEWHMTGKLVAAREMFSAFTWATAEETKERYALPSAFKAFRDWVK